MTLDNWLITAAITLFGGTGIVVGVLRIYGLPWQWQERAGLALPILRLLSLLVLILLIINPRISLPGRSARKELLIAIDTSSSMGIIDSTGLTRLARGAASLGEFPNMIAAGEPAVSISPDSIPWIEFTDAGTDLGRVISSAFEVMPTTNRILLVSDGCHNRGPDPAHVVGILGREVSCLFVNADGEQADLAITSLQAPSLVLPNQKMSVNVRVGQMGGSRGVATTAKLTVGGREMDTKDVVLHPNGTEDIELSCELVEAGMTTGRVRIEPVEGENLESNNTREFPIEVRKSKWLCSILFSKPSWDLTFLRRSLLRDGGFDVVVDVPGLTLESERIDREETDVLIVGLYSADEPEWWRGRAREVVDRGGALVLLGWPNETRWGGLSPLTCFVAQNEERRLELREGASTHPLATLLVSGSIEKQFPPLTLPSGEITQSSRASVILETADGRPSLAVHPVSGGYALAWVLGLVETILFH